MLLFQQLFWTNDGSDGNCFLSDDSDLKNTFRAQEAVIQDKDVNEFNMPWQFVLNLWSIDQVHVQLYYYESTFLEINLVFSQVKY